MNGYPTWQGYGGTAVDPTDLDDSRGTMTGRTALVTAGRRDAGDAIIRRLARNGAAVAIAYRRDKEHPSKILSDIKAAGLIGSLHQADVDVLDDCRRMVAEVVSEHGSLDILINNSGIAIPKAVLDVTDLEWETVLSVNLLGASHLSHAALEHMVKRGTGRIINVSSIPVDNAMVGQGTNTTTIAGLDGLTKTLAKEAASMLQAAGKLHGNSVGITVNGVTAGFLTTEITQSIPKVALRRLTRQIPLGRFAQPEEVARLVDFLADDASGYITGQVWGVNGGMDI